MYKLVAVDEETGYTYKLDDVLLWGCWTKETLKTRLNDELYNRELEVSTVDFKLMLEEVCDRVEGNSEMIDGDTVDNYIFDACEEWEREHEQKDIQ